MDFVIVANAWSAVRNNPTSKHQIALELVRKGHRVLWMEGAGMRRPSLGSTADRGKIVQKIRSAFRGVRTVDPGRLWVLAPLTVPLPSSRCVRVFNGWLYGVAARRAASRLGFREPVLINYVPVLSDAMRGWRKQTRAGRTDGSRYRVVYHCVDRWEKFDMYDAELMRAADAACHTHAELVVASSKDLYEHCRGLHKNVHLVNHGVDYAHFSRAVPGPANAGVVAASRPADVPTGAVVGFWGLLSEWVDQQLLVALARRLPEATILLIGAGDVPVEKLEAEPNIVICGPKPFADLPEYLACFEVGIIPFVVNELTRAVNPIKLREMLAGGCPVVSTALPEAAAYADARNPAEGRAGVCVSETREAFVNAVAEIMQSPFTGDERRALSETMRSETWSAKVEEILALVG